MVQKGDSHLLPERPEGCFAQKVTVTFLNQLRFLTSQRLMAIHRQHLGVQKRTAEREVSLHQPFATPTDSLTLSRQLVDRLTSPSLAALRNEMYVFLQEVIDSMEPLDREILSLRHYEELTNREAASELGISEAAASKRYVPALQRLRSVLVTLPGFENVE
jgi:RNA polymerase sigma-70 factor (ECF subfamily)